MSDNEQVQNVDDALGFNLGGNDDSSNIQPVNAARVARPRNLKDHHLTSVRGLPYIRQSAKKRVRKAMNHKDEYKNLTSFLSFYQIWGHNIFPKAKFSDFLEMCATAGSERAVRDMRRGFMDEDTGKQRDQEMAEAFVPSVGSLLESSGKAGLGPSENMSREEEERLDQQDFEDQMFEQAAQARSEMFQENSQAATTQGTPDNSLSTQILPPTSRSTTDLHTTQSNPLSQPSLPQNEDHGFDYEGFDDDDDDDFLADIGPKKVTSTATTAASGTATTTTKSTTEPDPSIEEFDENQYNEEDYEAEMQFMREQGL